LALAILGVGLACENELDRTISIRQNVDQPLSIMQEKIRSFVSRETAGKAQSQCVGVEYPCSLRKFLGRSTSAGQLPDVQFAYVINERFAPIGAKLPKIGVADRAEIVFEIFRRFTPAIFPGRDFPQAVCLG
jgi:hypothetical protein